jgi:hypothetical protein
MNISFLPLKEYVPSLAIAGSRSPSSSQTPMKRTLKRGDTRFISRKAIQILQSIKNRHAETPPQESQLLNVNLVESPFPERALSPCISSHVKAMQDLTKRRMRKKFGKMALSTYAPLAYQPLISPGRSLKEVEPTSCKHPREQEMCLENLLHEDEQMVTRSGFHSKMPMKTAAANLNNLMVHSLNKIEKARQTLSSGVSNEYSSPVKPLFFVPREWNQREQRLASPTLSEVT